eukprot:115025-Pelagomonas_calceolata.AAC.2
MGEAHLFWQHTPVGAVHCLDPAKIIHCLIQLIVLVKAVCLQQGLKRCGGRQAAQVSAAGLKVCVGGRREADVRKIKSLSAQAD